MKILKSICLVLGTICFMMLAACNDSNDYTPKPKSYIRIDMPAHAYHLCDSAALPFTFECSNLCRVTIKKNLPNEKFVDIEYPQYNGGIVFLTYKRLSSPSQLQGQIDTSYRLLSQHFEYSTGVRDQMIDYPEEHVYTTTYQITGQRAASTFQFYATDSVQHFLRGSLFFNVSPNNDSLAPVIDYIQADIKHLLETLHWKE